MRSSRVIGLIVLLASSMFVGSAALAADEGVIERCTFTINRVMPTQSKVSKAIATGSVVRKHDRLELGGEWLTDVSRPLRNMLKLDASGSITGELTVHYLFGVDQPSTRVALNRSFDPASLSAQQIVFRLDHVYNGQITFADCALEVAEPIQSPGDEFLWLYMTSAKMNGICQLYWDERKMAYLAEQFGLDSKTMSMLFMAGFRPDRVHKTFPGMEPEIDAILKLYADVPNIQPEKCASDAEFVAERWDEFLRREISDQQADEFAFWLPSYFEEYDKETVQIYARSLYVLEQCPHLTYAEPFTTFRQLFLDSGSTKSLYFKHDFDSALYAERANLGTLTTARCDAIKYAYEIRGMPVFE